MTNLQSVSANEKSDDTWTMLVGFISLLALCVGAVALFFALLNADDDAAGAGGSSGAVVTASLTEFAIEPGQLTVPSGGVVQVTNDGAAAHNLTVEDEDYATSDLNAGEAATLDLAGLEPGSYTVICTIAGHEAAGMSADLTV